MNPHLIHDALLATHVLHIVGLLLIVYTLIGMYRSKRS
jgi:hypothetical protein